MSGEQFVDVAAERILARLMSVATLPGVIRKQLVVPPQQVAVIDAPDERVVLPSGKHALGSLWGWFNGRFSQTRYVLLPTEPIPILLNSDYLAGDDRLVTVSAEFLCRLLPEPFYAHFLAQQGQISWLELEMWLAQNVERVLATAVADYATTDLTEPMVQQAIQAKSKTALMPLATAVGLTIESVRGLTITPAIEMLERARQQEALQAELRRLEQDAAMDKLTNEAELRAFAQQLEADFGVRGLTELVVAQGIDETVTNIDSPVHGDDSPLAADGRNTAEAAPTPPALHQISRLSRQMTESRIAAELGRRWARLHGREEESGATIVPSEPLWLRAMTPLRYLLSLITLGLLFFSFLGMDNSDPNYRNEQIKVLLSTAGLMLGVVSSLWAEARTRQKLLDNQVMGSLALLGRHDRGQADRFLRTQVLNELEGLGGKLRDARFELHKAGEKTAAVQLKEMELHVGRLQSELGRADTAQAAYLSGARLTAVELAALYNYDESLLLQLNHIADSAQTLLAGATINGGDVAEAVPALAAELTEFEHRFRARARFIRTPLADS